MPYLDSTKSFEWRDNLIGVLSKNDFTRCNKIL